MKKIAIIACIAFCWLVPARAQTTPAVGIALLTLDSDTRRA